VSRELAGSLRPLLFERLQLRYPCDLTFLHDILQPAASGWLAPHIHSITHDYNDGILRSTTLFSHLPSVQTISYWFTNIPKFPLELRPQLSHLNSLRTLELRRIAFTSFSALLRLVGAMPALEELIIGNVRWPSAVRGPDRLPDCRAGFRNLKKVRCCACDSPFWPVAWMQAAAATGYIYRRRGVAARNPDVEPPPLDIGVLVRTVRMVLTHLRTEWSYFILAECPEKGNS
jgi:hypothetical protein